MASSEKKILTYSILGVTGIIDDTGLTIDLEVPYGTDVTTLTATFTNSDLSSVTIGGTPQVSTVTVNDFTNPVLYTVTAEDLSTNDYTVTVTVTAPSTEKEIISFEVENVATGLITANSIQLKVEEGTDVTALTPVIEVSEFATVSPLSEVSQDFTNQVEYTVTDQDLSIFKYLASVVYLPNHNAIYSVYQFLLAAVPFIEDSSENKNLASIYTVEAMYTYEPCFNISMDNTYPQRVGNEIYYNVEQKSLIADIIAMDFLYRLVLSNVAGNNQDTNEDGDFIPPSQRFLKRAKAGSVESEFEQFKIKDTAFVGLDTVTLLENLKASIMRKFSYMGCLYDINEQYEIFPVTCGTTNLTFGVSG